MEARTPPPATPPPAAPPPRGREGGTAIRRDQIRWGPVIAGVAVTITTLVVLSALGLAIGLSALEPDDQGLPGADVASWIWTVGTSIVAFILGGLTAARTSALGGAPVGTFNGLMVGVLTIALVVALIGTGIGSILGAAMSNLGQIADVGEAVNFGAQGSDIAFEAAKDEAWGTFLSLVVALGASALGGMLGSRGVATTAPIRE